MGEFNAGKWMVGLLIYFFFLFVSVTMIISLHNYFGVDEGLQFNDPGFGAATPDTGGVPENVTATDTVSVSSIKDSLSLITGIGSGSVDLGIPNAYKYIASFLFFWIEGFMLLWSIYMSLPLIH